MPWDRACNLKHAAERDATAALDEVEWNEVKDKLDVRIGSDSTYGKVYRVPLQNGMAVAVKIWDHDPMQAEEINIARKLGRMAEKNPDLPYPIVKGAGDLPGNRHYLISELAVGDINQMFALAREHKGNISEWAATYENWAPVASLADWKAMIFRRVKCAAEHLHKDGFAHLDAHRGNFMCLKSGKVVIHDFGTCKRVTPERIEEDEQLLRTHFDGWGKKYEDFTV